jgi:excisionase family DNA binding protein
MRKVKNYLTTGQAAAIFDVDPDTVLRWIKSGEIKAVRTPGGHYRISRSVFLAKMINDNPVNAKNEPRSVLPYCWEYNSVAGKTRKECTSCIVYKSRSSRCYELCELNIPVGHAKLFCTQSCNNCQYYKSIFPITD